MDYDLDGRVVLVSGAASGIGGETAEVLAGMGAWIVAADIDADAGEAATAAALRGGGADARFVAADVADEDAGGAMVAAALDAFGRLDGAANYAGVGAGYVETHDYPIDV
jgi:NAD(P)-dependent dehydrogenase (short-subunit alcohol dehydrogenase family)